MEPNRTPILEETPSKYLADFPLPAPNKQESVVLVALEVGANGSDKVDSSG